MKVGGDGGESGVHVVHVCEIKNEEEAGKGERQMTIAR